MTRKVREVVKRGKSKLGLGNDSDLDLAKLVDESTRKAEETKRTNHPKWTWKKRDKEHEGGARKDKGHESSNLETGTAARGNSMLAPPSGVTLTPTLGKPEVSNMVSVHPDNEKQAVDINRLRRQQNLHLLHLKRSPFLRRERQPPNLLDIPKPLNERVQSIRQRVQSRSRLMDR
jgi:hypothetical protein